MSSDLDSNNVVEKQLRQECKIKLHLVSVENMEDINQTLHHSSASIAELVGAGNGEVEEENAYVTLVA